MNKFEKGQVVKVVNPIDPSLTFDNDYDIAEQIVEELAVWHKGQCGVVTDTYGNCCDVEFLHPDYGKVTGVLYSKELKLMDGSLLEKPKEVVTFKVFVDNSKYGENEQYVTGRLISEDDDYITVDNFVRAAQEGKDSCTRKYKKKNLLSEIKRIDK